MVDGTLPWRRSIYFLVAIVVIYVIYNGLPSGTPSTSQFANTFPKPPPVGGQPQLQPPVQPPPAPQLPPAQLPPAPQLPPQLPGQADSLPHTAPPAPALPAPAAGEPRKFNGEFADTLTAEQCDQYFPDLYKDIDRAVAYWKEKQHTITREDTNVSWRTPTGEPNVGGGAMRILIHDNELRVLESIQSMGHFGYRGRGIGALNLIQRAIDSATAGGEKLPTIEVAMVFQDNSDPPTQDGTHSFWTWAWNHKDPSHQRLWLMPNFDFWYAQPMGSYRDVKMRAVQQDSPFVQKIKKIVWRGSGWVNWPLRGALVEQTKGKEWADVIVADWGGGDSKDGLSVEQLCKYAATVHTEGITYSGRLKYLLNCDSLTIIHDLEWTTYYMHLLKAEGPDQNYINVKRDWTDLEAKVTHYFNNPQEAEKVIANQKAQFRNKYLTRAATSCYIRKLIHGYSSVSFAPNAHRVTKDGWPKDIRGVSFEKFMDAPDDRDFDKKDDWRSE